MIQNNQITNTAAKTVVRHIFNTEPLISKEKSRSIADIAKELGLLAQKTTGNLDELCAQAMASLPEEVELVKKGNQKVLMKLVGVVMKLSKGSADGRTVRSMLERMISQLP